MSAKANLEWVEVRNGRGDVRHIESGRIMLSWVTLDEACKFFLDTTILVR